MKSICNFFFHSQLKCVRTFKTNNIKFRWKHVEDIFLRDRERIKLSKGRRTDILKYTIVLDNYTMTNATYTKQPFSDRFITEVIPSLSSPECKDRH